MKGDWNMSDVARKLLSSEDLKGLYRVTNPKLSPRPQLYIVSRNNPSDDWVVESSHRLMGYRACQTHLQSRVRQYEGRLQWPNCCELGIGIFIGDKLDRVLTAKDRGYTEKTQIPVTKPLDDILGAVCLNRGDVGLDE